MTQLRTAEQIKEVAIFCIANQGRCFRDWDASKIFRYIAFHFLSETLFVTRNIEGEIAGVAIAWTAKAKEILRRDERGIPQFAWGLPDAGNAMLIADVFGKREVCGSLWRQAFEKWPHVKRVFTYRGTDSPKLIELTVKTLNRFL